MRYGEPSGFVGTESPTVRIEVKPTPGAAPVRYGLAELLGPVERSAIATAAYQAKYGLLDRMDRALYYNFGTNYYPTWQVCFVLSILFQQVLNAHSLYREHLLCVAANKSAKRNPPDSDEWNTTLASFVLDIIKQLHP